MAQITFRFSPVRYRALQIFIENPLACKDDFEDDLSIVKMDLTNCQCDEVRYCPDLGAVCFDRRRFDQQVN